MDMSEDKCDILSHFTKSVNKWTDPFLKGFLDQYLYTIESSETLSSAISCG